MRKTWFALLAAACFVPAAGAQGTTPTAPPATPTVDPTRDKLDFYLVRWEEAMKKVDSLALACSRTEIDKVYQTKKTFTGTIHFLKPTFFFWNMSVKDKPQEFERIICSGTKIYKYEPTQKQIVVYPGPKTNAEGKLTEDSSVSFMFGMKAGEAKTRYDLKLFKEDENYVYIDVTAKHAVDKADFQRARVVLNKDSYMPRQIWFESPVNNGEILWDIPTVQTNVKIDQTIFAMPQVPNGWKMVQGQTPPPSTGGAPGSGTSQPRLVRPQER